MVKRCFAERIEFCRTHRCRCPSFRVFAAHYVAGFITENVIVLLGRTFLLLTISANFIKVTLYESLSRPLDRTVPERSRI